MEEFLHVRVIFILEEQFEKEFSAKEKAKLYKAICYQENEVDPAFPTEVSVDRCQTDIFYQTNIGIVYSGISLARGEFLYNILTGLSVCHSVRQSCCFCRRKSSFTAPWNFEEHCSYLDMLNSRKFQFHHCSKKFGLLNVAFWTNIK